MRSARAALAEVPMGDFPASLASRVKADTAARQTLKQRAREGIMAAILSGAIRPGEKLLQKELAEGLGISITPVREALNELSADGFVHLDPHRGAVVRRMSEREMVEINSILGALIPLSAQLMVENITDAEIVMATGLQDDIEATTDISEFISLNRDFHNFLTNCCRSPRLSAVINPLRDAQSVMLNITMRRIDDRLNQANREHRALLAALAARDIMQTVAVMNEHARPNPSAIRKFFSEQEKAVSAGEQAR